MRWLLLLVPLSLGLAVLGTAALLTWLDSPVLLSWTAANVFAALICFCLYTTLFLLPVLWFELNPGWAGLASVISPGVLLFHLVPGLNTAGDRIGSIPTSAIISWIVHAPGFALWSPMEERVRRRSIHAAQQPEALLDSLSTSWKVEVKALAWHQDHLWLAIHTESWSFLVVTDADGVIARDHWGQGIRLPSSSLDEMFSTPNGLLIQSMGRIDRVTEAGIEEVARMDGTTMLTDGYLAFHNRLDGTDTPWLSFYDHQGHPTDHIPGTRLHQLLELPQDQGAHVSKIGTTPDGVLLSVHGMRDEARIASVTSTGEIRLLRTSGDLAYALSDGSTLVAAHTRMLRISPEGEVVKTVEDLRYPIGFWNEQLIVKHRGVMAVVSPDLELLGPWQNGRFKGWRTELHPSVHTHWARTPDGRVLAFRPHGEHGKPWERDEHGPIAPLIRLRDDGEVDADFNSRYAHP